MAREHEQDMPAEAQAEWYAEEKRHLDAFVEWVKKWPAYRKHAAYALLGSAIGTADMMGADADEFIRKLRAHAPKPAPLVPPREPDA